MQRCFGRWTEIITRWTRRSILSSTDLLTATYRGTAVFYGPPCVEGCNVHPFPFPDLVRSSGEPCEEKDTDGGAWHNAHALRNAAWKCLEDKVYTHHICLRILMRTSTTKHHMFDDLQHLPRGKITRTLFVIRGNRLSASHSQGPCQFSGVYIMYPCGRLLICSNHSSFLRRSRTPLRTLMLGRLKKGLAGRLHHAGVRIRAGVRCREAREEQAVRRPWERT